ncbi:hypothetical protein B296_00040105 [Ensete ventricosum]|uniref:Uncharacterized protein n=1 Tax=Ensete ventricosum TaxID=4639 RepID=A0A426YE17_ENSVE|nr:hypothetical protein B296_00040105 [Ensete ventricosum]
MSREGQDHAEVRLGITGSSTLVYDTIRRMTMDLRSECRSTVEAGMVRVTKELDYFSAHIRLRELSKSEDKVEALVVKGAEEVENAEANSKYQVRAKG